MGEALNSRDRDRHGFEPDPDPGSSGTACAIQEPAWIRRTLIASALAFLTLFLLVPLIAVFVSAFGEGPLKWLQAVTQRESWSAIKLTLLTALIAVPLNVVVGVAAAWLIGKFRFPGRSLLLTLVDLPFSISPVIAGLMFVMLLGKNGPFGFTSIIFAPPGIVIATVFVTFPFVAREVLPLMQAQGNDQEEAALTLGASGWQTFWRVTLPRVKWGLLYGVVLCNARAMGEFGAVSVVSGHIRGVTNTLPLHVEILYNEYAFTSAFAVASLLTLLALVTLAVKKLIEWRTA